MEVEPFILLQAMHNRLTTTKLPDWWGVNIKRYLLKLHSLNLFFIVALNGEEKSLMKSHLFPSSEFVWGERERREMSARDDIKVIVMKIA